MTRYLITGNTKSQDEFVKNIIEQYSIPNHQIIKFEAPFSIKNAHSLRGLLSLALPINEKRCVLIPSEMSLDAQNALLKVIEELDEGTVLIIINNGRGELLPTILSRIRHIRLDLNVEMDKDVTRELSILKDPNDIEKLMRLSFFLSEKKDDIARDVLLVLREFLRADPHNMYIKILLENIFQNLEIFYKNNIHKRFFWDTVLLTNSK